jgi:hypothetical protein
MRQACPDGAWLVELATVSSLGETVGSGSLATAVIETLGIREPVAPTPPTATRPVAAIDRLAGVLRTKRSLLLLDNCEHVVEPVAELAERLLTAAPGLRVLATSREPLRLAREVLWIVPPLEIPDQAAETEPDALQTFGAVQLFVARAAAAPGFALDATTPRLSPRSAGGSTESRWPSNWRPPACAGWATASSRPGWMTGSGCSSPATEVPTGANRPCER